MPCEQQRGTEATGCGQKRRTSSPGAEVEENAGKLLYAKRGVTAAATQAVVLHPNQGDDRLESSPKEDHILAMSA